MEATTTMKRITIDPATRLEGHAKIEILLNDSGEVDRAFFQIPELRGFEKFAEGRPAEDMPQITSRICGVCPTAHHMASTKALDSLYKVTPPAAARKIRELVYSAFMVEDHALHVYFLGGPDFLVGPQAPAAERNVLGVIARVGLETGRQVIGMRRKLRELIASVGGKVIHPVLGLPGGVAKAVTPEQQNVFRQTAAEAVDFARFTLEAFEKLVLARSDYVDLILSDAFTHRTYYMGMVDAHNRVNFYDGAIRVVSPAGEEVAKFPPEKYLDFVAERVEPWSYGKICYLKPVGWRGFVDGPESGIYSVAPLARLNAADGMATPLAQAAYEEFYRRLGGKPVHHTLANHWARVIELLYAAERLQELAADPELVDPNVRRVPTETPTEGVGIVEAPRGTLIHHYVTDARGLIRKANLIVATQGNAARINLSVDKAAKAFVRNGNVSDGILNLVEMAFRAYDPCHGCSTHSLPGSLPLAVEVRNADGSLVAFLRRDSDGRIRRD